MLDGRLLDELKRRTNEGLASGDLMSPSQIAEQLGRFAELFGPSVLRRNDGVVLLRLMHGRSDPSARSLVHWLEFKNDDEFRGPQFGGIGGGAALKFMIFQRKSDGAWIGGSATSQKILSEEEAIEISRKQRDELLAGDEVLRAFDASDTSDASYAHLQTAMEAAAPRLSRLGWAHKYWFLLHSDKLDDYHSGRYQRFHLIKLLQMPPDKVGILDPLAPRFNCAGRFIGISRELDIPVSTLDRVLNQRDTAMHRYWKIGTTAGSTGESQWELMQAGGYASVGWHETVGDLSSMAGEDRMSVRNKIRDWLLPITTQAVASRKAGEIAKFAFEMAENDIVVACTGQTILAVGRVRGAYEYDGSLIFPHKRPVEWISVDSWQLPEQEGPRTTVYELGRSARNLLELEERLLNQGSRTEVVVSSTERAGSPSAPVLPTLDPLTARIEGILRRKGQAILYGPPGTGKTYCALRAAKELAARHAFNREFTALSPSDKVKIDGPNGLVQTCSFHPGYGYEDFVEGLRPRTAGGQMTFELRPGIFKQLCEAARSKVGAGHYLIIDEINRGDIPRIFGELITVLEYDKRGTKILLSSSGEPFSVPENVFIIGTMNTADRSISLLDTALRRRFGFVELMPDSRLLGSRTVGQVALGPWLDSLNIRLRRHLKRDARNLQVGHAYLMTKPAISSIAEFAKVVRDDLIPLLEEYCYDDFPTLKEILGDDIVDVEKGRIRDELFDPTREHELVEALSFEEMQDFALAQGIVQAEDDSLEVPDDTAEPDHGHSS